MYAQTAPRIQAEGGLFGSDLEDFMLTLFIYNLEYKLGPTLGQSPLTELRKIRLSTERSRIENEAMFARKELSASEFVTESNHQTISFQQAAAGVLKDDQYRALFDLAPGEFVTLADPEIINKEYLGR
jgi:hypothetical protein